MRSAAAAGDAPVGARLAADDVPARVERNDAAVLERSPKLASSARDPALHRRERNAEHRGGLAMRQARNDRRRTTDMAWKYRGLLGAGRPAQPHCDAPAAVVARGRAPFAYDRFMRGFAATLILLVPACAGGGSGTAEVDASAPVDGATVHTMAPSSSVSLPGPNNATLAMALGPDGTWSALTAKELGVYVVPYHGDRWTAAFVCADDEQNDDYIAIYDRAASVKDITIDLAQPCALPAGEVGDVTGTFAHAPPETSWFDFGYLADERASSLPLNGDSAEYEIVHVVSGTWDLVFGFRENAGLPLTKLIVVRDEAVTKAGVTLDADLAATGIVPGANALTVSGLTADEQLAAPVIYALGGGIHGIDLGPQSTAGPNLTFATVPAAVQRPTDRYRLAVTATASDDATQRGATAVFHDAIDVALDLLPALPAPAFRVLGDAPYLRLSMSTVGRANTATYVLSAVTRVNDRSNHAWTYDTDAAVAEGAPVSFDLPDFSSVPGWNPAWALAAERTTVTATAHERESALSDGAVTRFTSHSVPLTP